MKAMGEAEKEAKVHFLHSQTAHFPENLGAHTQE